MNCRLTARSSTMRIVFMLFPSAALDTERERAAAAAVAHQVNVPAEQLGQPVAEIQSEAGAFPAFRLLVIDAFERAEDPALVRRSDAGSRIADGDDDVRTKVLAGDRHLAGLGELDRIVDEVGDDL